MDEEERSAERGKGGVPLVPAPRAVLPPGSWRDPSAYADILRCGPRGLAWELLRRDPAYEQAARAAARRAGTCEPVAATPGHATRWGLHFLENPARGARDARLLWTRAADPSVLSAAALDHPGWFARLGAPLLTVRKMGGPAGADALVIGDPCTGIRIDAAPRAVPGGPLLGFDLTLARDLPVQLRELERLWRLWNDAPLSAADCGRHMHREILALRTIDALADGASLRQIGAGLISDREWPGDGEWVKSRARRIVAAARAMWAGGPVGVLNCVIGAGGVSNRHGRSSTRGSSRGSA